MPFIGLNNGDGPIAHGCYTVVAADDTAGSVAINTKLSSITMAQVMVTRAGKVATSDVAVSWTNGVLTVGDGSTFLLTTDDKVCWLVVGK